jgi:hypothetical protein
MEAVEKGRLQSAFVLEHSWKRGRGNDPLNHTKFHEITRANFSI